ncbi:MAG TPA: hypothetical protein VF128_10775, partial [Gemmatimonadaceae bacterium]
MPERTGGVSGHSLVQMWLAGEFDDGIGRRLAEHQDGQGAVPGAENSDIYFIGYGESAADHVVRRRIGETLGHGASTLLKIASDRRWKIRKYTRLEVTPVGNLLASGQSIGLPVRARPDAGRDIQP